MRLNSTARRVCVAHVGATRRCVWYIILIRSMLLEKFFSWRCMKMSSRYGFAQKPFLDAECRIWGSWEFRVWREDAVSEIGLLASAGAGHFFLVTSSLSHAMPFKSVPLVRYVAAQLEQDVLSRCSICRSPVHFFSKSDRFTILLPSIRDANAAWPGLSYILRMIFFMWKYETKWVYAEDSPYGDMSKFYF